MESDDTKTINIEEIIKLIPHRYPFLLIERVQDVVPETSAIGIKNVTINEPYFPGHFPDKPIMPGVLIIEAMAQTAAVLVVHSTGVESEGKVVYFMSIDNARFRKPVVPGDVVHLEVETVRQRGNVWKLTGKALVDDKLVSEATFAAMIADVQ